VVKTGIDKIVYRLKMVPVYLLEVLGYSFLKESTLLKWTYFLRTGEKLNLENPVTFNEKLQWLKLYDRNPLYGTLVDKLEARKLIEPVVGKDFIVPLLGSWKKPEDIDFDALPDKFVLKCNHDSGSYIICEDKKTLNQQKAIKKLNKHLKRKFYMRNGEWPYKNVQPAVICEKLVETDSYTGLILCNFYCFGGTPRYIRVYYKINGAGKRKLLNTEWEPVEEYIYGVNDNQTKIDKPGNLAFMLESAGRLSAGFPFVRIDFLLAGDKTFFSEITFTPGSGYDRFSSYDFAKKLGDMIDLNQAYIYKKQ
jgi:hypothetical protein